MKASKILREPLLHFVAIGALLFVAFGVIRQNAPESQQVIRVSPAEIQRMKGLWEQQWRRPPTHRELESLLESHIREEVLYREAVALGMDRDDIIVRRRMVQKLNFLIADVSVPTEPDPSLLEKFFAEHQDDYESPAKFSFSHIYFSREKRGAQTSRDAEAVLSSLLNEEPQPAQAHDRGDWFPLRYDYVEATEAAVARDFGTEFAEKLTQSSVDGWQGPTASGYGLHLVNVQKRIDAHTPKLANVHGQVVADYQSRLRREATEAAYERMRERYTIVIDGADDAESVSLTRAEQ